MGDQAATSLGLPPISNDGAINIELEAILDTWWVRRGAKFIEESLVKWRNLAPKDTTWENTAELLQQYPTSNLKDKCPLEGGVMIWIWGNQDVPSAHSRQIPDICPKRSEILHHAEPCIEGASEQGDKSVHEVVWSQRVWRNSNYSGTVVVYLLLVQWQLSWNVF